MARKSIFLFSILTLLGAHAFGQCATVDYNKDTEQSRPDGKNRFERWIKDEMRERARARSRFLVQEGPYTIPVVVHVIHNGEPEGEGRNISRERINNQIRILNEDFQRKNEDAMNTPPEFRAIAGKMNINFVLAKQDPEGIPSTGIVRVNGGRDEWVYSNSNTDLKSQSYWAAEDYLNIWIANIVDSSLEENRVLLGYAQFPSSNRVRGINLPPFDAKTDGIVMLYEGIGTNRYKRTLTHEVGHFLGLRHIWGDVDACDNEGDYVDDTPRQSNATDTDCPTHPFNDCEGSRMFQNYMDYTNGDCQNVFTKQQIERMSIILNNSPQRKSLLTSKGAIEPELAANNLGLRNVISPQESNCDFVLTPRIAIRNYGTNTISSARIQMRLNGDIVQVKNVDFDPVLEQFEIDTISYDEITLPTTGEHTFTFNILQTNNTTDGEFSNDTISRKTIVTDRVMIPFYEPFDEGLAKWSVQNPDQLITWVDKENENDGYINNSAYINFYGYPESLSTDKLISPILTFPSGANTDTRQVVLKFDWFYPTPANGANDFLKVTLSSDCYVDSDENIEIFSKSGRELATTLSSGQGIQIPSGIAQWKTFSVALDHAEIVDLNNLQIVFEGTSGYGEDLYVDNVSISRPPNINTLYRVHSDPTFKDISVTFNLKKRESVRLQVYSITGRLIFDNILSNALDQTYTIPMANKGYGIYIFRLQFKDRVETTRIFVNP